MLVFCYLKLDYHRNFTFVDMKYQVIPMNAITVVPN